MVYVPHANKIKYFYSSFSKVHISKATLDALGDTFCVEPGDGKSRSSILESQKIKTFFITSRITVSKCTQLVQADQCMFSLLYTPGE